MAKRKSKGRDPRHKVASLGALTAQELLAKGNSFLTQEKYQDAILCFKQLLKQGEHPEILDALEQAYLGRIRSLAAKSMIKEALVLLETVIERWPNATVAPLKLSLLVQEGRYAEAARLYTACGKQLAEDSHQRLDALFGALLLAGSSDLKLHDFAEDSAVFRYYPVALAAIEAVFAKDDKEAHEALKQIPFRSPYRDLRTFLTGCLHFQSDKVQGSTILRKIAKDSPYFGFAARYLATTDTPENFLQDLAATPKQEQQRFRVDHDLSPLQFNALVTLSRSDGKPHSLYHFVKRYENCFDKKLRVTLLNNILPFCKDEALSYLTGSRDFTQVEKNRICALAAEKDGATTFAVDFWDDYLGECGGRDPANHKEIAMVMRRQAKLQKQDDYEYSPAEILNTLLKSLEHDPGHAETWLTAAEFAKRHISSARHYAIINDAVAKLPENVAVLVAAMRASGARGAHKKAAGLAQRILEIDPINTSVLDFLVESRLEHGRKLASQRKWTLAEKELQGAATRVKAVRYRGRQQICLGMLMLLQDKAELSSLSAQTKLMPLRYKAELSSLSAQTKLMPLRYKKDGLACIAAGKKENGFPLLSHILTSLESRLYILPKAWLQEFDRELVQVADAPPVASSGEFLRLINWLLSFDGEHLRMLKEVCQCLTGFFVKAALLPWSRDEGLLICKALEQGDLIAALAKFSVALYKKYPDSLEFKVWGLVATARKGKKAPPWRVVEEIEELLDELEKKGRFDFVHHIDSIMEKWQKPSGPSFHDFEKIVEDIFNSGPFRIPKKARSGEKAKPKPAPKPKPAGGKQLNLFDDE